MQSAVVGAENALQRTMQSPVFTALKRFPKGLASGVGPGLLMGAVVAVGVLALGGAALPVIGGLIHGTALEFIAHSMLFHGLGHALYDGAKEAKEGFDTAKIEEAITRLHVSQANLSNALGNAPKMAPVLEKDVLAPPPELSGRIAEILNTGSKPVGAKGVQEAAASVAQTYAERVTKDRAQQGAIAEVR